MYEFMCRLCKYQYDTPIKNSVMCPKCEHFSLRRIYTIGGTIFKGSGFYKTDSRKDKKDG